MPKQLSLFIHCLQNKSLPLPLWSSCTRPLLPSICINCILQPLHYPRPPTTHQARSFHTFSSHPIDRATIHPWHLTNTREDTNRPHQTMTRIYDDETYGGSRSTSTSSYAKDPKYYPTQKAPSSAASNYGSSSSSSGSGGKYTSGKSYGPVSVSNDPRYPKDSYTRTKNDDSRYYPNSSPEHHKSKSSTTKSSSSSKRREEHRYH